MKLRRIWLTTALLALLTSTTVAMSPAAAATKPSITTTAATKPSTGAKAATPQAITPLVAQASAPAGSANWTTYHHDNARSAYDANEGTFSTLGTGWTNTSLTGDIYAEPLVYQSTVYIATEDNYLYALQDTTGTVLWSVQLSTPMNSSGLPCGNITPHVGITGTPVIDTALNRIYMVGMVSTGHYVLWGVDLSTHALLVNHLVDPANLDVNKAQGQRGALAISQGVVYVPYGGRAGDCFSPLGQPYHGIVLGARETDGAVLYTFQTNGTGSVWASGGESVDSSGNVYVAIGNGTPPDSERVFKLSPTLTRLNSWVPVNQSALDSSDQDVGSIIPTLVGGGDIFQNGKSGDGYLLSSTAAQLQGPTKVCTGLSSDSSFGAAAYNSPYIYVPCSNGLYALKQTGNAFAAAWSYTTGGVDASPPIIAGGNVIFINHNLDTLVVLNATTGAPVTSAQLGTTTHFGTPATGNGLVFAAALGGVYAFTLVGCTSANMSPSQASPAPVGATVTFTATSTGCTAPQYRFLLNGAPVSTTWGSGTWAWNTTGLQPGLYGIGVWVRSTGSTAQYESWWLGTYQLTFPNCVSAHASTLVIPPAPPGSQVAWTASSLGCTNPEYRFYVLAPGGTWTLKRGYGAASWTWNTTGLPAGAYQIGIWARQIGSSHAYDVYNFTTFVLGSGTCNSAQVTPLQTSPQVPGATVTVFGSSNGCATPSYEFWLLSPGATKWVVKRAFSTTAFWNWVTTGYPVGTYQLGVWVKKAGSTHSYDAYAIVVYTLNVGNCTSASLTPSLTSPRPPGTSITFTASSTGCTAPGYMIWERVPPSTTWVSKGPYTAGTTYVWNTTGQSGPYQWGVWARQNGSTRRYDAYAQITFWVGS